MPAQKYGNTLLVFGVDGTVYSGLLQSTSVRKIGKYSEAVNFEDDVVGIAVHHSNIGEIDGTALFNGTDIVAAIGDTVPLSSTGFTTTIVYEIGIKRTKDAYAEQDFKAVGVNF